MEALAALASRAEAVVATGARASLRDTDHALREIKEALAHPGHFPSRRERDELLARLEAARRQLYPLLQQLREDVEWKRFANVSVQEELAARAEALVAEPNLERAAACCTSSTGAGSSRRRRRRTRARRSGRASRRRATRSRLGVDAFLAQQAEEHAANLAKKQALCEKAEALAESSDWVKTAETLRVLQAEWKAIGPVPRAVSQRVWERFRKPCDRFFTRFQEHRGERSREWEQNLAKKEALCEKAEALAASTEWEEAAAGIKQLQAEWRTIGPVKKTRADAVWQRFRTACDRFFDNYKNRDVHAREAARQAREGICAELEALAPADGPPLPSRPTTWSRACRPRRRRGARRAACRRTSRKRSTSASSARATGCWSCIRARSRAASSTPTRAAGAPRSSRRASRACSRAWRPKAASAAESATDLAARLRDALASNTIGGKEAVEQRWNAAAAEIETAQSAWKRLGPLPGAEGRALVERFELACRRFQDERPRPDPRRAEAPRPERPRRDRREGRDRPERPRR